jgi:hypothetical protein
MEQLCRVATLAARSAGTAVCNAVCNALCKEPEEGDDPYDPDEYELEQRQNLKAHRAERRLADMEAEKTRKA